jgi:rfaE bifunctional protein kinase chain/domain
MTRERLDEILNGFARERVAVLGDFFLDKYLEIDPALSEISLETGLEARQVVAVRCQPGGAGNVAANLRALGVGEVICVGFTGDDGDGLELTRALRAIGADTNYLMARPDRRTPTYCKPILRLRDGQLQELERLDTKNRTPVPPALESGVIASIRALAPEVTAVMVQDQVQEPECGVVTTGVRDALAELVGTHPNLIGVADSRTRAGLFRGLIAKCNGQECCATVHSQTAAHSDPQALCCAAALSARVGAPVFLTMGSAGMAVVTPERAQRVPTIRVEGPLDIVGAGDSAASAIVAALCAGAALDEAAVIGNIVASITIQQVGTTGAASQEHVQQRFTEHAELWRNLPPPEELRASERG